MSKQGLSLADIAGKLHEEITVGDSFIRANGISAQVALRLIEKYPAILAKALQGGGFQFGDIVKAAPQVLSAIIVAGTGGQFEDEEALEDAAALPLELQMDILEAIGRLTFKNGFGPFAKRLMDLANSAAKSVSDGRVPDMKSLQESNT